MRSSSFNDAGRRHELRPVRRLPAGGAKLPNGGLEHHALFGRVAEHSSPARKSGLQRSPATHPSRLRTVLRAFGRLRFDNLSGRLLLELALLCLAHR